MLEELEEIFIWGTTDPNFRLGQANNVDRGVESMCTIHPVAGAQTLVLLFGLAERAILDRELNDRRVDDPGSENNFRKLEIDRERVWLMIWQPHNFTFNLNSNNFLIPLSAVFFHGASSGSYGRGPCTGGSSSTILKIQSYLYI